MTVTICYRLPGEEANQTATATFTDEAEASRYVAGLPHGTGVVWVGGSRTVKVKLRRDPGTSDNIGTCPLCGERLRMDWRHGRTECKCGAIYNHLTRELIDQRAELGHTQESS